MLAFGILIATALHAAALVKLVRFCLQSDFYSYIPLIPVVSAYLIWTERRGIAAAGSPPRKWCGLWIAGAVTALAIYFAGKSGGWEQSDFLCLMTISYLCCTAAVTCWCVGRGTLVHHAFALLFLLLMIPLPAVAFDLAERWLQVASANVAYAMFTGAMMPIWREGTLLHLPGMNLEVAPECCGIHSTLVLFITSLLAGRLFLRRMPFRAILIAAALPIALIRNGFRILVIGELCVHEGPDMINSPIHVHGGPIFFMLSLVPFLALLQYLRARDLSCAPAVR